SPFPAYPAPPASARNLAVTAQDQIAYPSRSLPQTPISALITTSLRQARSGIARLGAKSDRPITAPDCHPPDTPTITTWRPPDPAGMAHPDSSFRAAVGP